MYRNYMKKGSSMYRTNCCCNNENNSNEDMLEDSCLYMQNNMSDYDSCDCGFDDENNMFPVSPMYAQSYVPWQTMDRTFKPCIGLKMGTIFPELVDPYMPGQSESEIAYLAEKNEIGEGCNKC